MLTPSPLPVTVFDYLDSWLFCTRKKPVSQIQYTTFENIAKEHGKWIVPFLVKGSRDNVNQREIKQDGVEKSRLVEFFFFYFLFFFQTLHSAVCGPRMVFILYYVPSNISLTCQSFNHNIIIFRSIHQSQMVESTSNDMLDDRKYYDIQGYHSWSSYKYRLYP